MEKFSLKKGENRNFLLVEKQAGNHSVEVSLAEDSRFSLLAFCLGGGEINIDVKVELNGKNANVELSGLSVAKGSARHNFKTLVEHNAPNCKSGQIFKCIADDSAGTYFDGSVIVRSAAQKTEACQRNNNILLSPDARVESCPGLEIYADDVRCSHGSTTGSLDKTALFYLESRGIPPEKAQRMLIEAFAGEILDKAGGIVQYEF